MRAGTFEQRERRTAGGDDAGAHPPAPTRRSPFAICAIALAGLAIGMLGLGACSGPNWGDDKAGLSCVDDSAHCVEQRQAALKALVADKSRAWVKEPASPQAHATGVRLFAFRSTKAELSCEELSYGHKEAASAPKALKGHQGLTPAQVSRASLFAAEVQRELAAEMKRRRCRV